MEFNFSTLSQNPEEAPSKLEELVSEEPATQPEPQGEARVIYSASEEGYWSNSDGWGALATATRFGANEAVDLPASRGGDAALEAESVAQARETMPEAVSEMEKPQEPATANDGGLDALMKLAAGKVSTEEVNLDPVETTAASPFQLLGASKPRDPDAEEALEDLASVLARSPAEEPIAPGARAPGAVPPLPPQQTVAMAHAPGTVGEMVGQMAARAIETPFIALSSAARHLKHRLQSARAATPMAPGGAAASLQASQGFPMANTLETITDWKCERIEKTGSAVESAASALMETEEYQTWEEMVRKVASERSVDVSDIASRIQVDEELTGLKEQMDRLWWSHPEKVEAYRSACHDFERNIRNVVKEFPNSDEGIRDRITGAMDRVQAKSQTLPGFGDKPGEYERTMVERMRELAAMIAEFMQSLLRKVGVKTRSADATVSL